MRLYKLLLLLSILLMPSIVMAQSGFTSVTATVQDSNSTKYVNSPFTVTFYDPGTSGKLPTLNGSSFQRSYSSVTNSSGLLSISLPDNAVIASTSGATNTQWTFSICTAPGTYTTQFCIPALTITITGASQNISSAITAVAPILPISGGGSNVNPGTTGHIGTYVNSTTIGDSSVPIGNIIATSSDNSYSSNNRFRGPIPFIDISSFMPAGGCSEPNGNAPITATFGSGTTTISVSGAWSGSYYNGCGVMIEGAGAISALAAPAGLAAVSHMTGGATSMKYKMVACDNNEGCSAATSAFTLATSDTWANLTGRHYNFITASPVANTILYCVKTDKGLGGAYTWIGCNSVPAFKDMGWVQPVPSFLPPPATDTATAQSLFTTIVSGGTTSTWVVADATITAGTSTVATHDISGFLNSSISALSNVVSGSYAARFTQIQISSGQYTIAHSPAIAITNKINQVGQLTVINMPIILTGGADWDGGQSSSSLGQWAPGAASVIIGSATAPVVMVQGGSTKLHGIAINNIYGTGVFVPTSAGVTQDSVNFTEVATQKGCTVQYDTGTIIVEVTNFTFTAGTGADNQTQGANCWDALTSTIGASGITYRDGEFVNKAIWAGDPDGQAFAIFGINFNNVSTENNNEDGFVNMDNGDNAGHRGYVNGMVVLNGGQDNSRNNAANFTDLECYNSVVPGASCGLVQLSTSVNPYKEGQTNPVGVDTLSLGNINLVGTQQGLYSRLGLIGIETTGNAGSCQANWDLIWPDSAANRYKMCNNSGPQGAVAEIIGTGTSTTNGTIINTGTSQSQPAITITGAATTDTATCSLNAAPVATWQTGIQLLPPVVTANTVTIWLSNPTAGNITPAATVVRCTVTR